MFQPIICSMCIISIWEMWCSPVGGLKPEFPESEFEIKCKRKNIRKKKRFCNLGFSKFSDKRGCENDMIIL